MEMSTNTFYSEFRCLSILTIPKHISEQIQSVFTVLLDLILGLECGPTDESSPCEGSSSLPAGLLVPSCQEGTDVLLLFSNDE